MLNSPGDDAHDGELDLDFGRLEPDDGPDPNDEPAPEREDEVLPSDNDDCAPLDDEKEQVGYELYAWESEELDALDDAVHELGLPHEWVNDGYELVVHTDDEEAVDALLPTIRAGDVGPDGEDDDATDIEVLAALFVAVVKLRKDPTGSGVTPFLDAAERIGAAPPYGLDDRVWDRVTGSVDALIDGYQAEAPVDVLRNLVDDVHRNLRPLV